MRLPFSGSARAAISTAGELEPIVFDVETQAGVIELPRRGLVSCRSMLFGFRARWRRISRRSSSIS